MSDEPNKIVLLGDESDVNDSHEFNFIPYPVPRPPCRLLLVTCRLLLVGSCQCGKTNVALNLITRFWIYPNSDESIFDEIYIFTPTALSDPKLKVLAKHPDLVNKVYLSDKLETDLIDELLARKPDDFENGMMPHTLVFVDDFAGDKKNTMSPSVGQSLLSWQTPKYLNHHFISILFQRNNIGKNQHIRNSHIPIEEKR